MESWAEALAMMTTTEPLLLRSEVKKEEAEIHHHDHGSHHLCGMEECSDSSLYSPTTTGLQLELEFGQDEEEEITDSGRVLLGGALINVGGSGGSYGSTMSPPSIAPSPDDELLHTTDDFSPTPLDLLEADQHLPVILIRKRVNSVLSSSSSSSSSSTSSSGRNKKIIQQEQNGAGSVNQGTARTAAEETDVSTISPLSSTGLCRSISRSYSSPEPDEGGIQAEGTKTQLRQQPQQQQPTQQTQPQYVHCSSTTASVPGEFTSRHRNQSDFKDDDAPKRLCLVCGDVASGFHYGVASCEACKAFFKRTIQGNIEYNCPAANDCEINKRRRKACQACRFQKCIRMGMLKEGVRLDRVRGGRQKYRRVTPYSNNNNNSSNTTGAASTTPNASSATCNESTHPGPVKKISLEDNKILSTLGQCEPEMLTTADIMWPEGESSLANLEPALRILITLSELYDRELVAAIGWAKQIPGFLEMPLNDQMRLLQTSWPEVLSLSLAFRSIPINAAQPKLQWSADFCMNEKEARECGMEELFFQCVQIAQRLEQLSVTREEYYLLKALVLINCDVRVESMAHVKTLRETVLAALTDCSTVLRQGSGGSQHLQLLLLCMPCIRQVDSSLRRFWALIRRESRVPMNKLFLEMLESPMR